MAKKASQPQELVGCFTISYTSDLQGGVGRAAKVLENGDLLVDVIEGPLAGQQVVIPKSGYLYTPIEEEE